jgi:hypothetical protein
MTAAIALVVLVSVLKPWGRRDRSGRRNASTMAA